MRKDFTGTPAQFATLHNRLYGPLFSFVRLRINDQEEVKDIVQDVFLKAYNSWSSTRTDWPDESSARNFLYIMARQRMIDIWRSARNRLETGLDIKGYFGLDSVGEEDYDNFDKLAGEEMLPEEVFAQNEQKQNLLRLLNQLKKEEREILILRFLEEMEYKELAKIYKVSEDNIRQKVSRSLQNLRKVVNKNTTI